MTCDSKKGKMQKIVRKIIAFMDFISYFRIVMLNNIY